MLEKKKKRKEEKLKELELMSQLFLQVFFFFQTKKQLTSNHLKWHEGRKTLENMSHDFAEFLAFDSS